MRKSDIQLERRWEHYRRSVAENMPESAYKTAVLAAIEHALMRLDSIEASLRAMDPNDIFKARMEGALRRKIPTPGVR